VHVVVAGDAEPVGHPEVMQQRPGILPPPHDMSAAPRVLVAELRDLLGEAACAEVCAELLAGAEPGRFRGELAYLGGKGGLRVPDDTWKGYWARVWGARGLLYVWAPSAAATVVAGLADPHWRVAEMCLKVSALRELAAAGDPATALAQHDLPRVRATAVRALGLLGDTEHVVRVRATEDDEDSAVRRAAELALRRMTERLDMEA